MRDERIDKILVKPSEAADMIGVSRSKVYELIASGSLPAVHLEGGKLLRVPIAALQQLADRAMTRVSAEHSEERERP